MVKYYIVLTLLFTCLIVSSQIDTSNNYMITYIEKPPLFNGKLDSFIQKHIVYPERAKEDSIKGTVFISFWVDTTGNTIDHKTIRGIREDLNQEAIRVTKLIKFKEPAMQRNKPIKVRYTVPVKFKISSEKENKKKECKE